MALTKHRKVRKGKKSRKARKTRKSGGNSSSSRSSLSSRSGSRYVYHPPVSITDPQINALTDDVLRDILSRPNEELLSWAWDNKYKVKGNKSKRSMGQSLKRALTSKANLAIKDAHQALLDELDKRVAAEYRRYRTRHEKR